METINIKYKILNIENTSKIANILFLICIFAICYLIFAIDKAEAKALSLGIYPPIIQIRVDPPASVSTPITIENLSDETVALQIIFRPFTASESDNGEVAYLWDKQLIFENQVRLGENIRLAENGKQVDETTLAPKQKKTLSLDLNIAKDEPLSDYYFSILFISKDSAKATLSHSQIQGGIGTNVLLSIGRQKPIGKILEFSAPSLPEAGPVPFTIRLQNEGTHFITAQGSISIKNMFGQTTGQIKVLPLNILADTSRFQKTIWQRGIVFGRYTAKLTIALSDKGPILVKNINFTVFPVKTLIAATIIIFILVLLKKRLRRRKAHPYQSNHR